MEITMPEENAVQSPEPQPQDAVQSVLVSIGQLRAKLLKLRGSNPKEYDRVLKQGFPLDVLTLLELISVEFGNRTAALAYRFDGLANIVLAEGGDDDDDDDEPLDDEASDKGIDAVRVIADYVRGLADTPDSVKAAIAELESGGLWDEDEPDEDGEPDEAGAAVITDGAGSSDEAVSGENIEAGSVSTPAQHEEETDGASAGTSSGLEQGQSE
jgi:hypothetical protein